MEQKGKSPPILTTQIAFNCGCSFCGDTLEKARQHALQYGHTLTVTGTVRPNKKKYVERNVDTNGNSKEAGFGRAEFRF